MAAAPASSYFIVMIIIHSVSGQIISNIEPKTSESG
jgi:hypothetical protein